MSMKQFNAEEMRRKIEESKKEENRLHELDTAKEISKVNQDYLTKMPEFITLKSLTSEERASIYGKVIEAAIIRAFSKSADTFNHNVKKSLERANHDDKITLTTTAFYIVMILLVSLLLFFGGVVFGNFRLIHSEALSKFIWGIIFFGALSMGLFLWLKNPLYSITHKEIMDTWRKTSNNFNCH